MKDVFARIGYLLIFTLALLISGCIYDNLSGEIVVTDQICVNLDEYRESPTLGSAVVSYKFKERLFGLLEEYDAELEDVVSISFVSGAYKVTKPPKKLKDRDWTITARVTVERQDVPGGPVTDGPAVFLNMTSQSLEDAKGKPIPADLNSDGVQLINRALAALLEGEDPRLVLTMEDSSIEPAPSASDPLSFGWLACVTFQAVVDLELYNE